MENALPNRRLFARMLSAVAVTVMLAGVTGSASAIDRPFPTFAKRGVMKPDLFPAIIIDGRPRNLTPGARIWNANNLIDMPASLPTRSVIVNYTEDENAYIDRVWILTAEEASQSPKAQNINQPRP